jgi:rhamnosyltransferase
MRSDQVVAVVVSFNGGEQLRVGVDALLAQIEHVLVVDNGSEESSLAVLRDLETHPRVTVTRLGRNTGMGHALNVGVRFARERGFDWILTMDQDSVPQPSMVEAFRRAVERDPALACLTPMRIGESANDREPATPVRYAITSGNLVRMSVFERVGWYDEGLFVDCTDFDFSLRVRRAGFAICRVADAAMTHQLGDALDSSTPFRRFYARHSPSRRYYMYRNLLYIVRRYALVDPVFVAKLLINQTVMTLLVGLLDPQPLASYRAMLRGVQDFFARRDGPMVMRAR